MVVLITFKNIQGLSTLIEQQRVDLGELMLAHMDNMGCIVPLMDHNFNTLKNNMHVKIG